ncbi:hypothetical protein B0H11DRAFT_2305360 [Mycena galericulata]|nr:hypothetical protein B0H11DRAFT_2305360 [Mycena galericulata]
MVKLSITLTSKALFSVLSNDVQTAMAATPREPKTSRKRALPNTKGPAIFAVHPYRVSSQKKITIPIRLLTLVLLSGALAAHVRQRAPDATSPSLWVLDGCYTDSISNRTLTGASKTDTSDMSVEACTDFCSTFPYSGVGLATPSSLPARPRAQTTAVSCARPSTGNAGETCGAPSRIAVYHNQPLAQPASTPQSVGDGGRWNYTGRYTDSMSNRVLLEKMGVEGGMTTEKCTSACQAKGFSFAGTEYAKGTPSLTTSLVLSMPTKEYSLQNTGVATAWTPSRPRHATCGAPATRARSAAAGTVLRSSTIPRPRMCPRASGTADAGNTWYTDSVSNRTFPTSANVEGGMTAEKWCGDRLDSAPASGCDMACTGDSSQNCGGGNRLSVFHDSSTGPVTTTCVDRTTEEDFTLQVVFHDGSPPVYLLATRDITSRTVITSCTNCSTPYISYSLYKGEFYAIQADSDADPGVAVSPPLTPGEFFTLSTIGRETSTGHCTVVHPSSAFLHLNQLPPMYQVNFVVRRALVSSEPKPTIAAKPDPRVSQMLEFRHVVQNLSALQKALQGSQSQLLQIIYEMLSDERLTKIERLVAGSLNEDGAFGA